MTKKIYIDICSGVVQAVYGDKMNDDIEFIVRDEDNIAAGDDDPNPGGFNQTLHKLYW